MASIKLNGDTSGEITISAPSVAGTHTLTLPSATETLATQNSLGVRNLIINGDMRIAQRATSVSGITSGSGVKVIDRMFTDTINIGTWTHSQDSDVPTGQGFVKSYKLSCTTSTSLNADSLIEIHQVFEGQNVQHIKKGTANAESLTLSFWVKTNKTGTYTTSLIDNDNTRHIGATYTISSADTWEKKTITFVGDTSGALDNDNNASLRVIFHFAVGTDWKSGTADTTWGTKINANRAVGQTVNLADSTDNYINITGGQLEVGTEATPFEHRPYDMELARCQRYYQKSFPQGTAPAQNAGTTGAIIGEGQASSSPAYAYVFFKTTMRIAPSTFTTYNPSATNASWRNLTAGSDINSVPNYINDSGAFLGSSTQVLAQYALCGIHYTADAEL